MYHMMYLSGLCQRRKWPEPYYDVRQTSSGYTCTVRVNNREYTAETVHATDELAREAAATRAYMICRNFSVNDGMYPGHRQGQGGVVQGLPVAIGAGRRRHNTDSSEESRPGSSSRMSDEGVMGAGFGEESRRSSRGSDRSVEVCVCGRGTIRAYARCGKCLREAGWQ